MSICGRFDIVSETDYRDGVVLVGFCGNVFPHDLSKDQINLIKRFYMMSGCKHEIFTDWPDGIEPLYPAAKKNFKNGFMLLTKERKEKE